MSSIPEKTGSTPNRCLYAFASFDRINQQLRETFSEDVSVNIVARTVNEEAAHRGVLTDGLYSGGLYSTVPGLGCLEQPGN